MEGCGGARRDSIIENLRRDEVSGEISAKTQSLYELLAKIVVATCSYALILEW